MLFFISHPVRARPAAVPKSTAASIPSTGTASSERPKGVSTKAPIPRTPATSIVRTTPGAINGVERSARQGSPKVFVPARMACGFLSPNYSIHLTPRDGDKSPPVRRRPSTARPSKEPPAAQCARPAVPVISRLEARRWSLMCRQGRSTSTMMNPRRPGSAGSRSCPCRRTGPAASGRTRRTR